MKFRIIEICKQIGITQKELSEKIGLSQVGLSKSINGNPTFETLEKIAVALNVPITDLFNQPATDVINCPYCNGKIRVSKG